MSKIRILSEHLANQIAAGEAIERPASVVKEFLENAIDARARQISVQVEGDGTRLIRVVDDGEGMDGDDVLLSLERHATSKLTEPREAAPGGWQLAAVSSLGFRGEAIPSIASVSRLTIISRPGAAQFGTRAEVRFGKLLKVHETGAGQGTVMEVRELFGNVPARRKFLKSRRTELSHIEEVVRNYALCGPHLGIDYSVDGDVIFSLPAGADSLRQRAAWLLGRKPSAPLLELGDTGRLEAQSTAGADNEAAVSGFLLPPDETCGPAARFLVLVNCRPVRDRMIMHAVVEGLAGFLMKGRSASGVLAIELPPAAVDVNVHPAKHEVRFRAAQAIHQLVVQTVRQAVARYQEGLRYSLFGPGPGRPVAQAGIVAPPPVLETDPGGEPRAREPQLKGRPLMQPRPAGPLLTDIAHGALASGEAAGCYLYSRDARSAGPAEQISTAAEIGQAAAREQPASCWLDPASTLAPVGQLLDLYILCESFGPQGQGLVVIDQHALHERLLFEELKRQFGGKGVARQVLLFPGLVELSRQQAQVLTKYQEQIARLGVELTEFGQQSFAVKAVPALLAHLAPAEIIAAILAELATGERQAGAEDRAAGISARIDEVLAAMACKAAVKAGRPLGPEEMAALVARLRTAPVFSHCPHGRPVIKAFSAAEIRKWFHRP